MQSGYQMQNLMLIIQKKKSEKVEKNSRKKHYQQKSDRKIKCDFNYCVQKFLAYNFFFSEFFYTVFNRLKLSIQFFIL